MGLFEQIAEATKPTELKEKNNDCPFCDGRGWNIWSCCGDDISFNIEETDLCPTCYEHCGDEHETCDVCKGTGKTK